MYRANGSLINGENQQFVPSQSEAEHCRGLFWRRAAMTSYGAIFIETSLMLNRHADALFQFSSNLYPMYHSVPFLQYRDHL